MKENKQRSLTLMIIAIALLSLVVGMATYAFFATTRDVNNVINANVGTAASMYSFSASSNGNIEINIAFNEMSEANISKNVLKSDNATIEVNLASPTNDMKTVCTYDIVWVWDSSDKYTEPDIELPYKDIYEITELQYNDPNFKCRGNLRERTYDSSINGYRYYCSDLSEYNYEFSVVVNDNQETDLSKLETSSDGKIVTIKKGEIIQSNNTNPSVANHNITAKIYNLPVDQKYLFGKNFKAHVTIANLDCNMESVEPSYHTTCDDDSAACTIAKLYTEDGVNNLYYHDGSGAYTNANLEIGDNSYRYAGQFNYLKASEGYNTYDSIFTELDWYDDKDCRNNDLCFTLNYDETSTKYTQTDAINKVIEDGYLEEAVNNYACFQGDDCTDENNLYRIIGVINNKVKLIKYTDINKDNTLAWNSNNENTWLGSTMETYLNGTYLNSLSFKDKIDTTSWYVEGMDYASIQSPNTVKDTYEVEISGEAINKKIGLMYVSDYGYAALPTYWNTDLYDYEPSKGNDWLLDVYKEQWTISRISGSSSTAFGVDADGWVYDGSVSDADIGAHPSFSLSSNAKITNISAEGVGSKSTPMIIA